MALTVIKEHPLASIIFLISVLTFVFRSVLLRELTFDAIGTVTCCLVLATGFYLAWVVKE